MNDFYKKGEDMSIPVTSNYMRFQEGDNKFRILGAFSEGTAIQGIEYWTTVDGVRKPVRIHKGETVPVEELEINKFGDPDVPRFFWAFPVWNYEDRKIQILEITQKTILSYIKKQIDNPKWGDPRDYDFIVTKGKPDEKPLYTTSNDPKEKLATDIRDKYLAMSINIDMLFLGKDPFAGEAVDPDEADKALS